jgi:hypothetical protein
MALQRFEPTGVHRGFKRLRKERSSRRQMARAVRFNLYARPLAEIGPRFLR